MVGLTRIFLINFVFCLAASAVQAEDCKQFTGNLFDGRVISDAMSAANKLREVYSENCFDHLTAQDREFLGQTFDQVIHTCSKNKKTSDCDQQARQILNTSLQTISGDRRDRILWALRAAEKKNQVEDALRILSDPRIADHFRKFSELLIAYRQASKDAAHEELFKGDPQTQATAFQKVKQYGLVVYDWGERGIKRKLGVSEATLKDENPQARRDDLHQQLKYSQLSMAASIQKLSSISESDKKKLYDAIRKIDQQVDYETEHSLDQVHETAVGVATAAAAVEIAAALTVANTTVLPYLGLSPEASAVGGHALRRLATGLADDAATTALSTSSTQGAAEVGKAALTAKTNSQAKTSRFLCELTREVDQGAKQAKDRILQEGWNGVIYGTVLGSSFSAVSAATKNFGPVINQLSKNISALGVTSYFVSVVSKREGEVSKKMEPLRKEMEELNRKLESCQADSARDCKKLEESQADRRHQLEVQAAELQSTTIKDSLKEMNVGIWQGKGLDSLRKVIQKSPK
jgi:hypothetical protein